MFDIKSVDLGSTGPVEDPDTQYFFRISYEDCHGKCEMYTPTGDTPDDARSYALMIMGETISLIGNLSHRPEYGEPDNVTKDDEDGTPAGSVH